MIGPSTTFSPLTPALSPLRGEGENLMCGPKFPRSTRTNKFLPLPFLKGEGEGSRSDVHRGNP